MRIALFALLFACGRGPDHEQRAKPEPGAVAHDIPGCLATLTAPGTYRAVAGETLQLLGPEDTVVQASCLPKRDSSPQSLARYVAWLVDGVEQANRSMLVTPVDASSTQRALGRPALAVDLVSADPKKRRGRLVSVETATTFYTIAFEASASRWDALEAEGERLFASLHITDPTAERGPTRWWHPRIEMEPRTLTAARASFKTHVKGGRPDQGFDGRHPSPPPRQTFSLVHIRGPQGRLAAYITPDPGDGKRHPAVVWAHGGFGGIDREFWDPAPRDNDQSARAFREAGIVLAIGSWRAENDNPGDYELYYGEVDDLLALRDHVRKLPYVDPQRIYLAGHSSGGTLVLLAAEMSDGFRAAFSIGGQTVIRDLETYDDYGGVPFDASDPTELLLRQPAPFVRSIRKPTFYFEGAGTASAGAAQWMEDEAAKADVPFKAFIALHADHFSILAPVTDLIAAKILADTGPTTNVTFTQREIDALPIEQ